MHRCRRRRLRRRVPADDKRPRLRLPLEYRIDSARAIVFLRGWGVVTFEEAIAHQDELRADPAFRPHMKELIDFREVGTFHIAYRQVRALALNSPFGMGARRAIVVDSDLLFGISRMYQALSDRKPENGALCRSITDARAFLGLPPEAA